MIRIVPPDGPRPLLRRRRTTPTTSTGSSSPAPTPSRRSCRPARRHARRPRAEGATLCAVGPARPSKLRALRHQGGPDARGVPRRALAAALIAGSLDGMRVLLPRADIGRDVVAEGLREAARW